MRATLTVPPFAPSSAPRQSLDASASRRGFMTELATGVGAVHSPVSGRGGEAAAAMPVLGGLSDGAPPGRAPAPAMELGTSGGAAGDGASNRAKVGAVNGSGGRAAAVGTSAALHEESTGGGHHNRAPAIATDARSRAAPGAS